MEEGVNTGHHRSKIAGHPKEEMDIFMFKKQIKQEMKPIHALRKSTRPRKQSQRMLDGAEDDESPPMKKPCKSFKINKHPDICKNGEPFKCSLCESPYINTSAAKAKKKLENEPIVKEVNGQLLELCVKCSIALNNTENKGPSPEEREMFEEEGKKFAQQLSEELGEPEAVRLYCSLYQTTKCGCIQLYINGTKAVKKRKNSFTTADISNPEVVDRDLSLEPPDDQADRSRKANFLLSLLKTSKAKKKLDSQKSIKSKLKKLSNEEVVNNKKDLETFILANRTKLKCLGICERGCQKVLCYSNNFLHKKLAVTGSKPRLEKTKGGVAEGRVPDLDRLATITCCEITCSQIALKENNRVAKWREQAQMSQKDMWQVIAEMLSFTDCEGKGRKCCYKFISLVTGCCQTTIQKVYVKTRLAKGDSTKPDHGMKSHWKKQKAETAGLPASKGMKSNVQTIESKSLQDAGTSSSGAGASSMMASTVVTLEQRLPPVTGILQSSSSNVSVVTAMSCFNQRLEEPNMPASQEQRQVSGASLKDSLSTVSNDDEELYAHFSMFKHQVTEKRPELLELLNAIEDGLKNRKDSSSEMGPVHTFVPASLANVQVSSLSSSTPVPSCVSSKVPQAVLLDSVLTTAHSDQRRQTMTVVSSNRLSSVETSLASQSPAVPHVASQSPVVPHGHPRSVPVLKSPSAQGKAHTNAGSHFIKTLPVLTPKVLTGKQVASPMGSNLAGNQVSNDQMQLTSKLCWNQVSTPIEQTKLTSVEKLDALPHSDLLVSYLLPTSGGSQNPVQGQISTHSGTNMSCSVVTTSNLSTGQLTTQAPSLTQDTLSVFLPNETLNLQHTKQVFPIDFNNTDNSSINYLFGASPAPGTNFIQVLAPQSLPDQRSINTVNGSSQSKIQGNAAASQSQPPAPASQYPGLFDALADSPARELAQQPLPEAQPKRSYLPEMLMTSMNSTVAVSASSLQSNVADISTDGPSQSSTKTVASHLGSAQLTTSSHSSSAAHKMSRTKEPPQVVIVNPYISGIETSDLSSMLATSQSSYSLPASQLTSTFQANENITVQLGAQQPHLSNLGNQQTLQLITSMSNPPQAANQLLTPFIQARTNTNVLISQNMNTGNHSTSVLNIAPGNPSPSNPSSNATLNIPPGNTTLNNISANSVVNIATGNQTLAISQSNPTLTIPQSNPTFTIPQTNPTFTIPQTNPTLTVPQGNPSADLTNMTLLSLGNQLYQLVPNTLTGQLQLIPFICANTSATPVSQYVLNLSPGTTSSFQAASDPVSTLSTDTTHQYQQGVTLVSPPFPSNQTTSQAPRHVLPNSRSGVGNQQAEQQPSTGATYISNLGDANHNQLLVPVSSSETNALNNSLVTLIPHQSGLLSSQFVPNQQQIMVSSLQDTTNNPNQQLIQWTTSGQGQASLGVESGQGSSTSHVLFENQPVDTQKLVSEFILSSLCQNSDRNFLSQQLAPVSNPNSFVTISNLNPKQASSTHQNTVLKSMIDSKSKPVACPTDGISKPASFPASEINQIHGAMSQLKVLLQGSDTSQANSIANQTNAWQLNVEATDNARKSYQQSSSDSSSVPSQPQLKANINPSMNANNQITKQVAGSSSLSSNTVNASNSRLLLDHLQKLPAKSSVNCVQNVLRENTQSHTGHQIRLRENPQSFSNQARLTEHTQMDHQAMLRENTLSHTDQQVELQDNKSTTQQSKATVLVQPQNVHIFMSPSSGSGKDEDKLCLQKVSEDKRSEVIPLLMAYLHGNPNVSCEVTPSQDFCSPGPSGTDIKGNQLRQAIGNNKCPSTVVTISTNQEFVESLGKGESGVNSSYLAGEFDAGQNVSSSTSSSPSEAYTYQCSTSHAVQVVPASGHASSTLSQSLYTYTTASADATNSDRSCPAFIRATNTPTDAVGPPNITVMSPSRHSSSHIPRLRADTCRTTSATFPLSDTVGVAMPNQSTKAGLQLLSHPSSNKSQSGMSVTSASFASVIGTPMSNPSSTNLSRVPATSQANVKVVGGSMPAHRNISVSVSSHSTQKPGSVLPASQLTLVSSSQATLPALAASHSKASTNYITPKPASTPTSHATSAKILEERFKLNCNQTKPRNRPYTVLQLLQQQEKEQALASQGPTSSAASSVGTTSMPSQTSTASLPLYTTANVLSGTQPIPTPAGPLTLVIPIPAASQVFTKDGSENRALFGQISFNSSNTGVAILQPNPLQPSPTQGSTLVLKKAISQPHQDNSNQPTSHSNTGSPAPNLASKIGPDPLTLPKLSNSTAFTPTHSKSISGSTASTLTASKLAPKTLKLQTPTSIACNLATQSSLPPFEANIKLIGQPQVSGNTSAINKKLNEKSLKLRSLPLSESQVQLSTNTNKPDFKPQDRKPGEDPHSRPGSVESTASTHSSHLDSPYPSKQHVLLLKRSQVNSTASGANLTYYADDTHKVKVHLQDNGADKVQFFQMDQLNDDAAFRNMEQFNSTHISHHTNPTNTLPINSTYALPINSNSLPTHLKTTNSLPTHLNITDHYKDKKSLPSQNPLLANILFESSQNISTNTQQTLSDAGVRMLSSHNKATLERASQGVFFQKNEAELSGPKINPSFDQWSRSCHPSGSETGDLQSPTHTLTRLLSAPVPENIPSRRIEKVINDIYKFPDDVDDAPNAVRYQSDLPDNMGSVQKKHGSQFDRSKANVPFTDDLCIDNSSESSMFKHSKHGHEKIISPKTTTKINLKKVQFSDEIGNSSLPTEVNSLNMVHSTPYNSLSLVSRNSSEDKVYKSESRNNNFMYKEDHEELSLNQASLKGTMSHRGGPKDSKLKALLSSKPDGTFALRYAEESLSESGVLISGVGFKKMNKHDACSGEYPKDLANTSNYSRSKFYSDQRYEELCSPIESASKHLLPSDPQDFASNSSFEILSPKGYSKLSGQRGKTLPNVVYMEDNSESGSQEARYEMGKSSTFFRKEIEESVERQNLERSQLLKSNFELAQQMNQNTEKSYAKFQSPYVEFHNYGELNYGEINSASKDDASNDMATEYVEAIQKSGKDGRSHGEENKLVYKARLDHLSPHEDGIHKKHMPSSGILKPSPLPECEPFKQVDGQRVRHPSGVKNVEDFSYLDSRHRSAGPHKSFGDLADGIRSRDPLVSFSSMSRHEADSSPQHERQRYPSAEFLALDSSRHRTTTQMFKFNDQDPPSYDISQRQRNPSSSSLKAFFLSDSEFPNFDGGNRSRNPSSSSLMKLEFIEHSFHPIRSRNPSGSSTRRSRPGSSSSDREFHMNNFDELPIFSDVMRTRSRNSSGESLEPTIDTIILDPNFQNYVRHKF